jgi:hypothetical protein
MPSPPEGWFPNPEGKYSVWLKQEPVQSQRTPGKYYNIIHNETGVIQYLEEDTKVIVVVIGDWASRTKIE